MSWVFIGRLDVNLQVQVVAEAVAEGWGSLLGWYLHLTEVNQSLFTAGTARVITDATSAGYYRAIRSEPVLQCRSPQSLVRSGC